MRPAPPTASIVTQSEGDKLVAPAAERNAQAILDLLVSVAPAQGDVLEIASGTGQHIAAFAAAMPDLRWHPSEITPERLASIAAYVEGAQNIAEPQFLDACRFGWADDMPPKHMIYLVNLLHLISDAECKVLITQAARALMGGGVMVFYGPFKRSGALTSDGDARFDERLRASDPEIGYKDDLDILALLRDAGLVSVETHMMPANNLAFVARSTSDDV